MNKHRINAIKALVAVMLVAGFSQTISAQDSTESAPDKNTTGQNAGEQKLFVEASTPVADTPVQTMVQPADNLLSEMKIYPAF